MCCDAVTHSTHSIKIILWFMFKSGTHGLNEELGRYRGREGNTKCSLCGDECENVNHVLWECSTYSSTRASFTK